MFGLVLGCFSSIGVIGQDPDDAVLSSLIAFVQDVEHGYFDNPYHSFLHAVDVLYVMYYILVDLNVAQILGMNKMEISALLIAALTHDILHPGLNNLFHINTESEVAEKYENQSVLENLSCDRLSELLEKHKIIEILEYGHVEPILDTTGKEIDTFMYMHRIIRDSIMNTDMCFHFQLLKQISETGKCPFI
jgi:hypothetical protein